jgi:hypothetical protein
MADPRKELTRFSEAEAERLVKFYTEAEREILDRLNRALLRGNKTEYLAQTKKNIEAILADLRAGSRTWTEEAISRVYTKGAATADMMIKAQGQSIIGGFGAIHQQAAQVLAENTFQRLDSVAQLIGRRTEGLYRDLALENIRGSVAGYDTWQQVARRYREQLAERGVTGFQDAAKREWNMRTYAEMVARTSTMEAHLQGTANRLVEHGHDLVKVSTHAGACKLCQPWQGKILSITGKTPGYPTLEEAKAAGLFHPNCRHAYGLHIDLDKEIEELEGEPAESKPQYYTEIQGFDEAGKKGLANAFEKAINFGLINKRECLLTVDAKTGHEVYSIVEGGKDYVQFPPQLITFLEQAKANSIVSIHNHPSSSSFSAEDLIILSRFDSIKTIAVIGHDGTRYVVSIGSGQTPSPAEIKGTLNAMVKKYYNHYNSLVQSGKMAPGEAWKEHTHQAVSDLSKNFGWEYRRVMPGE